MGKPMDILSCDLLDNQCLPLVYGLTLSRSKDHGNKLLSGSLRFQRIVEIRTGKCSGFICGNAFLTSSGHMDAFASVAFFGSMALILSRVLAFKLTYHRIDDR